ncbi:hypothetical protein F4604DRAFT_1681032 [Suillus subluteus]|nr:hypothetical protein F4604DRAFT_1681032 [Suillus subluteus]
MQKWQKRVVWWTNQTKDELMTVLTQWMIVDGPSFIAYSQKEKEHKKATEKRRRLTPHTRSRPGVDKMEFGSMIYTAFSCLIQFSNYIVWNNNILSTGHLFGVTFFMWSESRRQRCLLTFVFKKHVSMRLNSTLYSHSPLRNYMLGLHQFMTYGITIDTINGTQDTACDVSSCLSHQHMACFAAVMLVLIRCVPVGQWDQSNHHNLRLSGIGWINQTIVFCDQAGQSGINQPQNNKAGLDIWTKAQNEPSRGE